MARKSIAWILDFTNKLPNDEERVKCLQANDTVPMRTVLAYALDPNIKWLLPEGDPPYIPNEDTKYSESVLYSEIRKLYLFVEGGNPDLKPLRREQIFIDLLQIIDPKDAILLLAAKDKKLPFENLTYELIKKAYPGLLP